MSKCRFGLEHTPSRSWPGAKTKQAPCPTPSLAWRGVGEKGSNWHPSHRLARGGCRVDRAGDHLHSIQWVAGVARLHATQNMQRGTALRWPSCRVERLHHPSCLSKRGSRLCWCLRPLKPGIAVQSLLRQCPSDRWTLPCLRLVPTRTVFRGDTHSPTWAADRAVLPRQ